MDLLTKHRQPSRQLPGKKLESAIREAAARRPKSISSSGRSAVSAADRPNFKGVFKDPLVSLGWEAHPGLATLYTDPFNDQDLLIDMTKLLDMGKEARVLITAMEAKGTYIDDYGQTTLLGEPLEDWPNQMLAFRLAPDWQTVDVLHPQQTVRTTDEQMRVAVEEGADSPWWDIVPVVEVAGALPGTVIVDGLYFIYYGFFLAGSSVSYMESFRILSAKSYGKNFDVTIQTLDSAAGQRTITFSLILLPAVPMAPRVADDRIGYFTQAYVDLGVHQDLSKEKLDTADDLDTNLEIIWKYDLDKLPDRQIKVYVDPTVPERYRQAFKDGIEQWNAGFELAGHRNAIKGVLPGDKDWPFDYDRGDARFNTISYSVNVQSIFSEGIAKVDPRSGEVIKSDILMSDGWVAYYLAGEALMTKSQVLRGSTWREERQLHIPGVDAPVRGKVAQEAAAQKGPREAGEAHARAAAAMRSLRSKRRTPSATAALLARPPALLAANANVSRSVWEEISHQALAHIVAHEVGHTLGLRHNFKGSLGVSYECTQDIACTAIYGTSTSVMDYVDMNLPGPGVSEVDYFSKVIGSYDKLAIQYGYKDAKPTSSAGPPKVPDELAGILMEAEKIPYCKDGDDYAAVDPTCQDYDFSGDPVYAFREQLSSVARAQSFALEQSAVPGKPYWEYGDAAYTLANKAYSVGAKLVLWMGGFNTSYVHVGAREAGSRPPITPMNEDLQRDALTLILQVLRPVSSGFTPPLGNMPFLVQQGGDTSIIPLDFEGLMSGIQTGLVGQLFTESRLESLNAGSLLGGLSVAGFLQQLGSDIFGFADGAQLAGQAANTAEEWSLQSAVASALSQLECTDSLPQEIAAQVSTAATAARTAVSAALSTVAEQAPSNQPTFQACAAEGEACSCTGVVSFRVGEARFGSIGVSTALNCTAGAFDIPESVDASGGMCVCLPEAGSSMDQSMGQLGVLKVHLEALKKSLGECNSAVSEDLKSAAAPQAGVVALGGLLASVAMAMA